jgi:tripartite-type tricarboxylate transporter receptor subunit TctC
MMPMLVRLLVLAWLLHTTPAAAQRPEKESYPIRPIRFLVPFTPGGNADIFARAIAQPFGDALGQQIVVDNRPGSGGVLGTEIAASSPRDGYTLMVGNISTIAVSPALYPKLRYAPVRDFAPVSLAASAPFVLVASNSLAIQNLKELVALAKAKPGKLNYASTGIGSPGHLGATLLSSSTGIAMQHVPYKALGAALLDMVAGEIHLLFLGIGPALAQTKAGKIRALAMSSAKRSPLMPDLPTVAEAGVPGFDVNGWYGLFVPTGTPAPIVSRLHATMSQVAALPELRKQFSALGAELTSLPPDQFAAFVGTEMRKWAKVVKDSGMKAE